MAVPALLLIVVIVLSAIALPVVLALRRRAWRAALVAGTIGFGAQALFVSYLQSGALGPEQGALALLAGIPGVALVTCLITTFVILRVASRTKT